MKMKRMLFTALILLSKTIFPAHASKDDISISKNSLNILTESEEKEVNETIDKIAKKIYVKFGKNSKHVGNLLAKMVPHLVMRKNLSSAYFDIRSKFNDEAFKYIIEKYLNKISQMNFNLSQKYKILTGFTEDIFDKIEKASG